MVVKINGTPIACRSQETAICDEIIRNAPKLRRLAITWWITSGIMLVSAKQAMAATDAAPDVSDQLMSNFQDLVIKFGALAIVVGLVLLVAKKKWGVKTLKMTLFITGGVFLAPTILLIVAIIAYSVNGSLESTLQHMRSQQHH